MRMTDPFEVMRHSLSIAGEGAQTTSPAGPARSRRTRGGCAVRPIQPPTIDDVVQASLSLGGSASVFEALLCILKVRGFDRDASLAAIAAAVDAGVMQERAPGLLSWTCGRCSDMLTGGEESASGATRGAEFVGKVL